MGSVLQAELNARTPVQPKAVVLKTLDGIQRGGASDAEEPRELRSRLPTKQDLSGRVEQHASPVEVDSEGGSGRLLLVVAATLLLTVGAVWQWRNTLFQKEDVVALNMPVEVVQEDPATVVATPDVAVTSDTERVAEVVPSPPSPVTPEPVPPPVAPEPAPEAVSESRRAEDVSEAAEEGRERRLAQLRSDGRLLISSDRPASVYVDGRRVGRAPMASPGVQLRPGHYDIKVVPHGRGRTYRTNTRIDAGRVRNINLDFSK